MGLFRLSCKGLAVGRRRRLGTPKRSAWDFPVAGVSPSLGFPRRKG